MKNEHPKDRHIRICREEDVSSGMPRGVFSGFRLTHKAFPEIDLKHVETGVKFIGRDISAPLIINCMTGGTQRGGKINRNLARAANKMRIPLFLGSCKAALEGGDTLKSFSVRKHCPDVPMFANIGLSGLGVEYDVADCCKLVNKLDADGIVFYVNPLHEALQPEGNTDFSGMYEKLARACDTMQFPVIVKEVGFGIGADEVLRIIETTGVSAVDIAGRGGTDWALVEMHGHESGRAKKICKAFEGWGQSCAEVLHELSGRVASDKLIASGGIRDGVDVVKVLCLGAGAGAAALPFLKAAEKSTDNVVEVIDRIITEIRIAMFCSGAANVSQLGSDRIHPIS